jgi:hypothetical protein
MRKIALALALTAFGLGCDDAEETAKPAASQKPTAARPAPTPTPAPTPSAAVKKPSHPCPEGSKGDGTYDDPCVATGKTRIMEVKWNGKISDKGPTFQVINKSDLEILYGRIFVYFYDKAGKLLEVGGDDDKKKHIACGGNIFAGPMKAGEKAFLNFSCIKKDDVPEGAQAIEGELETVGFTDDTGKKSDTYWQNKDLVPDDRPKGGIKK